MQLELNASQNTQQQNGSNVLINDILIYHNLTQCHTRLRTTHMREYFAQYGIISYTNFKDNFQILRT